LRIFCATESLSSARLIPAHVGRVRLRHLRIAVAQAHDPRSGLRDQRLRKREQFDAIVGVELGPDVADQLDMLLLVLADRHVARLVEEHVRGLQHRIGVQADARALAVLAGLFLELRHAVQPADPRRAVQDPGEFRVGRHRGMIEQHGSALVDPARDQCAAISRTFAASSAGST
jgi:hypothetical protein